MLLVLQRNFEILPRAIVKLRVGALRKVRLDEKWNARLICGAVVVGENLSIDEEARRRGLEDTTVPAIGLRLKDRFV